MQLNVQKPHNASAEFFIRRAGYGKIIDRKEHATSYVYRLSRTAFYPRLHLYIASEDASSITLNLHLDQKAASYEGSHMHSGEYDGDLVEKEALRIKEKIAHTKPSSQE